MSEAPEAIRERIHAEELAKGSDPRVAEGRAKAAEMRARHGLPIEPQEAWRAKLAQEGGAPTEAAPKPSEPAASEEVAPAETEPQEAPAATEASPAEEQQTTTEPAPAAAPPPAASAPEPSAPVPAPEPEVPFDPEIGDLIVVDQSVSEIGGVKVRDARLPAWLMVILLAIPLWAMLYLLALGGEDVATRTSECVVQPDRTFVCFQPVEETTSGGGGH